jgi:hypothetical protein
VDRHAQSVRCGCRLLQRCQTEGSKNGECRFLDFELPTLMGDLNECAQTRGGHQGCLRKSAAVRRALSPRLPLSDSSRGFPGLSIDIEWALCLITDFAL